MNKDVDIKQEPLEVWWRKKYLLATAQILTQGEEHSRGMTSVMEIDVTQDRSKVSTEDRLLTSHVEECFC